MIATLFLISTLSYADRNVLSVVVEGIKQEFHLSDTLVGLLIGGPFAILFALFGIPIARLADLYNRKSILLLCLFVWSCATLLCGLAGTVWMLALSRMLVGAGEAGAAPTSHSLVADYCSPAQRSRAYSALTASAAIGGFLALAGGGFIAGHYGWRSAFLVMGAASLPVLVLAARILIEPRNRSGEAVDERTGSTHWLDQLWALAAKRSYVLLATGLTIYGFVAYGPLLLAPTYLIRVLGADVFQAGLVFGPALGLGTLAGSFLGGLLGDRLVQRNPLWLVRIPSLGLLAALPAGLAAFTTSSMKTFLLTCSLMVAMLSACLPVIFAAVQAVCGSGIM
ncbi:MFS transporter [Sphingomonas sp. Root710]|uniref:MFS transporter n=1 Tax=Sphingomonas sp. Root710 TaxID=1736594 RepID=UPI00138F3069|nr:MFS transporter [Sphingomonas sp. Root710]